MLHTEWTDTFVSIRSSIVRNSCMNCQWQTPEITLASTWGAAYETKFYVFEYIRMGQVIAIAKLMMPNAETNTAVYKFYECHMYMKQVTYSVISRNVTINVNIGG